MSIISFKVLLSSRRFCIFVPCDNAGHTAEHNTPQYIKAFIYKMKCNWYTEDDAFVKNLEDAEIECDSAVFPEKQILHSMLAEMYWWYFQDNRYKYYNRSQTTDVKLNDIKTWDLYYLINTIITHYKKSLNEVDLLKKASINEYKEILNNFDEDEIFIRPTLYDFLIHRAIDFYSNEEAGLTKPVYEFVINNTDFFLPAKDFCALSISTADTTSFKYLALKLYQQAMLFHVNDSTPDAFVKVDLERLEFVNNNITNEGKDSLYLKCLYDIEKLKFDEDLQGSVGVTIANKLYQIGDSYNPRVSEKYKWYKKQAYDKCIEITSKYEKNFTIRRECNYLIKDILESRSLNITIEQENIPNEPFRALVEYKNTDSVFFTIYKTSYNEHEVFLNNVQKEREKNYIINEAYLIKYIQTLNAYTNFSVALPIDGDFQTHYAEVKIPALENGVYYIVASNTKEVKYNTSFFSYGLTTVTNLSYINRNNQNGISEFYVVNRKTGEPMPNVKVDYYKEEYNYDSRRNYTKFVGSTKTDNKGYCSINEPNVQFHVMFSNNEDKWNPSYNSFWYINNTEFNSYKQNNYNNNYPKTFFFTDRSIYRPGQTVYFKGIVTQPVNDKESKILPNFKTTVYFKDVNYQKIANIELTTNGYGTFSGTFTTPKNTLNGKMTIQGNNGSIQISVEDYKRPKFEVKFDTISDTYKLGEKVTIKGRAIAYSGANVDNAKVSYRVTRQTHFPWWYYRYWWCPRPQSADKEITFGTATTNSKGEFEIAFTAEPDLNIAQSTNPTFSYSVSADVTDVNGETHSATNAVNAGHKALEASVNIEEQLNKNGNSTFTIQTQNLNGGFIPASGTIEIVKLKSPERPFRDRKWEKPDKFILSKKEYYASFPFDIYNDENIPTNWNSEKMVLKTQFNTAINKKISFMNLKNWNDGMYKLTIHTTDKYGTKIEETSYFTLYNPDSEQLPYPMGNKTISIKTTCEPGENAQILIGTGFNKAHVLFEVETNNSITEQSWKIIDNEQKMFSIPVKEENRGNIGVHFTYIKNNRLYTINQTIFVPFTNKMLDISFETFRDKLQPGEKEQWKLRLKGKDGDKFAAEMVATLYDASLDAFRPHYFNFNVINSYNPHINWNSNNGFNTANLETGAFYETNGNSSYNPYSHLYNINWFGYSYPNYYKARYILSAKTNTTKTKSQKSTYSIISSTKQKGTTVSGTVYDETGAAMPGATILIKGTSSGTVSDIDGNFTINSDNKNIELEVSFVGYYPITIKLNNKGNVKIKVTLNPDNQELSEVVVVGYGTQKKSLVTGAITRVESKDIALADYAEEAVMSKDKEAAPEKLKEKDLSSVKARTNLNETAFFYPHLQTDENGDILINFTIPEALTRWKMLGFAHTKDLKYGFTENELVTQKELMVVPNAPRFFREGDTIVFTSKLTSLSENDLSGTAQLMLFDALTMKPIDEQLKNNSAKQNFSIKKGESQNLNWNIIIPEGIQAITYRVVAKAGKFSDGEESSLPVLSNRMLVTESLPLPIKGKQTKTFTFDKLVNNTSTTLRNHKLTLEYTSNPAWYAIQALPYLMEYPYECAEQTFSRFYANSIASHIANSSPRIKEVFDSWKNFTPDALLSNLEKNEELKGLLLEETPWVVNAKSESERKQRVALLFDLNRMANELDRALNKLEKMQVSNGGWPWFDGMPDDRYITQHIVCGMGKLRYLGVKNIRENNKTWQMVQKAVNYTDSRVAEDYNELNKLAKAGKIKLSDNHLGYSQIQYLYTRSFYNDVKLTGDAKEAHDYYLNQAKQYWLSNSMYMQGMIALALSRYDIKNTATDILKSIKEKAIYSEELGMYWKNENGWYWYQAPIETQALFIEAFDEVAHDTASVNDMKVWLLKQKQTQDWKTTRATTEACYALLLRGNDWLINDEPVQIKLGNTTIDPLKMPDVKVEAGTGYFKTSWTGSDIKPEMGNVTIEKKNDGVSWGALYWQYFEQLDKITPAETPLKLNKKLFIEINTPKGPVISPITDTTTLKPGDLIKVRIELRVDRAMEYVHMKDMRAAGLEPVNVLSQYKYQDGLGYYESTRDAATNFFFGWLPKGTYVFEYPLRVSLAGNFSNGITTIQCMYAPEYTSHSEGIRIKIVK
jgi:uncharacterized protein YfaS (alpha-2-macroglobulin family)